MQSDVICGGNVGEVHLATAIAVKDIKGHVYHLAAALVETALLIT
jgi:hypothetical protein